MRFLFLLILLGFFVAVIQGRPSQMEENNSRNEMEYESDNESPAEESMEESRFGDEDPGQELEQNRRMQDLNRNTYLHKNEAEDPRARANLETPEYKLARNREVRYDKSEEINTNDESKAYGKLHQYSKYIENNDANDQLEVAQHLTNHDVNNIKNNRMHNNMIFDNSLNKRTIDSKRAQGEEGDMLFESNNDRTSKVNNKNEVHNNEPLDINQRSPQTKQYYNPIMQAENKAMLASDSQDGKYLHYNRERREAEKPSQPDPDPNVETSNDGMEKSDTESEEMAIRKHIKKMSGDELEQLLNSLSEEKRNLLKKIIDDADMSDKSYESINKREITKKAGAAEDNSDVDIGQSESSRMQDGFSSMDISTVFPTPNLEATEITKQTENQAENLDQTNQKSPLEQNSENKVEIRSNSDNNPEKSYKSLNSFAPLMNSNKNQDEVASDEQVTLKTQNKRETNLEDMVDTLAFENPEKLENEPPKESHADEGNFSAQDDSLSKFIDEAEQSSSYDNSKVSKREIDRESEFDSKLKSLEESFPTSDAYDESAPYSGPLIRVKRKNNDLIVKKRSAALLPDAKVGFFPYNAESDNDDADEGNEFDDDGFYDPSPNFATSDNKNIDTNSQQTGKQEEAGPKLDIGDQSKSPISNASGGTMSLGSDTDSVLSGVEGVDENLMFSSGTRKRRKTDGNLEENVDGNNLVQSKAADVETKATSKIEIDIPNYQENDSFGGFPRNYEGDLGRYKRIRRLKQSQNSEEASKT